MIFSIGILMISSAILLIFDRNSRYTFFFVLMATGTVFSLFSLVFHISVFGNYYFYTTNPLYVLDYRIYAYLVQKFHFPLSVVLRFMNTGVFLYQLSNCMFALELHDCLQWYRPARRADVLIHRLAFAVPVITVVFCDPSVSNCLYILCHRHAGAYPALTAATVIYKFLSVCVIFLPVADLVKYAKVIHLPVLCRRIISLTAMLSIQHICYALLFYFSLFSISAEKVYRTGYWIFETQQFRIHSFYFWLLAVTLFLMVGCLVILLSFRLDSSMQPFLTRKISRNLTMMNNTLEDMLHSHKNQLFTLHICMEKLKKHDKVENLPEVQKLDHMITDFLNDTARFLDRLNDAPYSFRPSSLSQIIRHAVQSTFIPDHIEVRIDDSIFKNPLGCLDPYHLEQALINLLNNAVEAVEKSGRDNPQICISTAFFFRWIVIAVTDNGIGISPSQKKKLFLPHYSSKNGRLNWGLGLTYVYRIVSAHLGQIKISSRKNEYTSIMLMLPSVKKERTL